MSTLRATPLSTREWHLWFQHDQNANRATRERLVTHPRLFLDALYAHDEQRALARLRAGPEDECVADLRRLQALIAQLRKRLPALCAEALPAALVSALAHLQRSLEALQNDLRSYCEHDPRRDSQRDPHPASAGSDFARDQPPAQALA